MGLKISVLAVCFPGFFGSAIAAVTAIGAEAAAPAPAEPLPTDFDGVVSTGSLWALVGSNGELRELWRGPPERIGTHGGEPPGVLRLCAFGEVREGEGWRDLRTLGWTDDGTDGSRPGRLRFREAGGAFRFSADARRDAGAPIILRFAFSSPREMRFRFALLSKESQTAFTAAGGAILVSVGTKDNFTVTSHPKGAASVSGASAVIEVPPAKEAAIAIFPGIEPAVEEAALVPEDPPDPVGIKTGIDDLDALISASVAAVEANSFSSGVVIAGSDGWYKNAWIRDGTYAVLGADLAGRRALASRFFRFWMREGGFSWGGENEAQQPAIGILGIRTHALLLPPKEALAFFREAYPYVKRFCDYYAGRVEKEGMIGTAEEWICQVPAPTSWPNAEIYAGLAAGAKIAGALGAGGGAPDPADATRWKAAAARLKDSILEKAYDKDLQRFIPLAGPPGAARKDGDAANPASSGPLRDDRVDSGMLMLARSEIFGRGLGAVAAGDPRFASTEAWIRKVLLQADLSISRFDANLASPHYPGGEWPMWPITAAWAAQIEHLQGRPDRAWDHVISGILRKTGVSHAAALRQLPEQWRHDGRPVRTTRLLTWSHGELLTSVVFLLLGLDLEPEGADLGLSPSLPPGSRGASIRGWPFRGWKLDVEVSPEGARVAGRRERDGSDGTAKLRIALPGGIKELDDGAALVLPELPRRARKDRGEEKPLDRNELRSERARREAEISKALGPRWESTAGPLPPEGLRVATLFTAQEMRERLAGEEGRAAAIAWCRRHGVEHAFVESFRDGYRAREETLAAVRESFRAAGLAVSGCITPTGIGKQSTAWKEVSCYSSPETRAQIREVFITAAKLFDEIMIDDFLFTACECDDCKAAKGSGTWSEYRLRLMREVSARDILAAARSVRPGVRVIIKYPQWYEDFHNRGYDVLGETALFPAIWVGTETRDPGNARWGRKAQYEAYYIMRWLGGIGGEKTGGGWFDPYGTSPATYVEQARQTVLAGAKEMLLFCHDSLIQKLNAPCPEALIPELPGLRELAGRVRGLVPRGVAAPKPPHSQPRKGEEYFFDYVGMLGIPLVPCAAVPLDAPALLITSHSARDPAVLAWLQEGTGRPVLLTAEAEGALPAEALAAGTRKATRLSFKADPREVMDLPREDLDKLRADLLKPLGIRFEAPGRVALYLFERPGGGEGGLAAIENFNDTPAEVLLEAGGLGAEEKGMIVLPPSRIGEVRRERKGGAEAFGIPPRTLIAFGLSGSSEGGARDAFGGLPAIRGKKTGFFHVEEIGGRPWIITPEGNGFISKGINHLSFRADQGKKTGRNEYSENVSRKYGSAEAFRRAAVGRLKGWGFNTLGAWCDDEAARLHEIPYTKILNLLASSTPNAWLKGNTADVFSGEFEVAVRAQAERAAKPFADDPWLLGYFSDNELSFGPDWRLKTTLLERMLALPEGAPGRKAAEKLLSEGSGDAKAAAPGFAGMYARRYFEVCREAIRAVDPHHMVLGCRFAGPPREEVAAAAAGLVDVFSVNIYSSTPDLAVIERLARASRAPVMIGEFAFRGRDSGLPNSRGAGPVVETQADRARAFEAFVEKLLESAHAVGFHWFEHQDEPAEGRFDGEDSNYGLVNIEDAPYEVLVEKMAQVNGRAEALAGKARRAEAPGGGR